MNQCAKRQDKLGYRVCVCVVAGSGGVSVCEKKSVLVFQPLQPHVQKSLINNNLTENKHYSVADSASSLPSFVFFSIGHKICWQLQLDFPNLFFLFLFFCQWTNCSWLNMSELNAYFRRHSMYANCREQQLQSRQEVAYLRFDNVCYNKHSRQLWVWDNRPLSSGKITIIHSSGQNYWSGTAWRGIGFLLCFTLKL